MPKPKHRRLDLDDVLEGRVRPSARELLALIHEVNPSGHDHLSARETARRYAQKSRLQSLLVLSFPDEILVEPADEDGVIGLRHRGSGADACHAVLASLDEDARSWAQQQLDLGEDDDEEDPRAFTPREDPQPHGPPSNAPLDAFSTDELLRRGRAAIDAYDYPAARERLAAALDRGNQEAALLLLTVLVEHLGLDEDALAVEERLYDETLAQPEVRLLLALSAARTYQRDRAVRLVRAANGDAAAEVFVALARGALERDELDHAAGDVTEIQRRGPSHPALIGLADTVKKRRAEERAPLEAEARRLLDEGLIEEAETRAAAIVARWPESTVAHGVARAGQERRRLDEARALATQGREALDQGESARALGLLRRALTMGLRGDDVAAAEAAVYRAEAAERSRQEWEKAGEVIRLLREGHLLRGLTDYVALDDPRRDRVKALTPFAELIYLDQTGIRGAGLEARAAAQAVMALSRAIDILTPDPAGAEALVTQHLGILERLPDAKRCLGLAIDQRRINAQLEAQQRFNAALTTSATGARTANRAVIAQAVEMFAQVRRSDLDEDSQAQFTRYELLTRRMLERWDRAVEVGKLRKANKHTSARDALDGLIRFEESGVKDEVSSLTSWRTQRAEVVKNILRSTSVRPSGAPAADELLGAEAPRLLDVPQSLLPGGQELVLAESQAGLIFFLIVDVASGRVTRRATMRLNEPFEVRRLGQRAGRVVLLGTHGAFVEVDPRSWEMERAMAMFAGTELAHHSVLAPGGRFAWAIASMDGWWTGMCVNDLERNGRDKPRTESVQRLNVRPLHGIEEPRVVVVHDRGTLAVHEARGALLGTTHEDLPALLRSVTVHPGGKGLFALIHDGEDDAPRVRWAELAADGLPLRVPEGSDRTIEELDPRAPCETAVGLDARVVYVLGSRLGARDTRRLIGFAARAAGLERCFDVEVPPRVTLAQDLAARTVVAVSPREDGLEVVRLDATPPTFRAPVPAPPALGLAALNLTPWRPCAPAGVKLWGYTTETAREMGVEYIQHMKAESRKPMIASVLVPEDRPLMVARYAALGDVPKPAFAEEFLAAAVALYPDDPAALQLPAQRAAMAGRWAAVRDQLAPVDPAPHDDAAAQHHDHLLGAALLMTGDVEEARRVLARGAARTGGCCDLAVPLALVGDPSGCAGVRALDQALRAADACLAAGDPSGARKALSGLAVREAREVQTLARLVRAWLDEPGVTEPGGELLDGFVRRLAFTRFFMAHAEKAPARRRELPFAGARWDEARLDALSVEVKAWLDDDTKLPPAEASAEAPPAETPPAEDVGSG